MVSSFSKNDRTPLSSSLPATDYNKLLKEFYQQHNPAKLGEVEQTLQKYRGKEKELFAKLAKKYNTVDPLGSKEDDHKQSSSTNIFTSSSNASPMFQSNTHGNSFSFTSTSTQKAPSSTGKLTFVTTKI